MKGQYQTYPDGWGSVCEAVDRRITKVKQGVVHFEEATVGERRFWDAQVLGVRIVKMILVPMSTDVEPDDIILIGDKQYEVKQKQRSDKKVPASWLLSLSETKIRYRSDLNGN